ncbi:MAG: hypothetical protein WBW80_20635 [Acidimicrobiales bacterium]
MRPNPHETRVESQLPIPLERRLAWCRVDLAPAHRQPSAAAVVVAATASLVGSLLADAALVAIGTTAFPSTKGYVHFQFDDYAKLTIIGVVIACLAWPVVTRITSAPRWVFFRLAILVSAVLLLPDAWLLIRGSPPKAVGVLVVMHIAIAVITYNCLVHIARVRKRRRLAS